MVSTLATQLPGERHNAFERERLVADSHFEADNKHRDDVYSATYAISITRRHPSVCFSSAVPNWRRGWGPRAVMVLATLLGLVTGTSGVPPRHTQSRKPEKAKHLDY